MSNGPNDIVVSSIVEVLPANGNGGDIQPAISLEEQKIIAEIEKLKAEKFILDKQKILLDNPVKNPINWTPFLLLIGTVITSIITIVLAFHNINSQLIDLKEERIKSNQALLKIIRTDLKNSFSDNKTNIGTAISDIRNLIGKDTVFKRNDMEKIMSSLAQSEKINDSLEEKLKRVDERIKDLSKIPKSQVTSFHPETFPEFHLQNLNDYSLVNPSEPDGIAALKNSFKQKPYVGFKVYHGTNITANVLQEYFYDDSAHSQINNQNGIYQINLNNFFKN